MMKRFYPDTAAGGTDLEAILKSTPTRQQSHNPQTGVRIGEASHPGPICVPLDMARPGRRCRNNWCQVPLASQGPLECCPLCSAWPLCHRCVCQAVALGQCGCRATGQPVRVDQRRDAISTPGGPSSNMDTDCPPEVACVIPGCNEKIRGLGTRIVYSCMSCGTVPVCDRCFRDPPPKCWKCDPDRDFTTGHRMDYRPATSPMAPNPPPQDGHSPVGRLLLATAPTNQLLALESPDQRGGGGARSSGDNRPPGTTVVTAERRGCSGAKSSGAHHQPRPLVWPEKRVSTHRQKSVGQYVQNVRHGWMGRAILKHTRTARRWAIASWYKQRKIPRCLGRLCMAYIPHDRHRYICPNCNRGPVCLKCRRASIIDDMCTCPLLTWK